MAAIFNATAYQRIIVFVEISFPYGISQLVVRPFIFRQNDQPGSIPVQSVYCSKILSVTFKQFDEGRFDLCANGLVRNKHVVVLINDARQFLDKTLRNENFDKVPRNDFRSTVGISLASNFDFFLCEQLLYMVF